MTARTLIERDLPGILGDLGAGSAPDYTDSILARTAATRQRPGWVFPERWLPMSTITERTVAAPRVPWRTIGAIVLLILALAAAAVFVGSRTRRVPAPFGPAGNGLVAFADSSGAIKVGDLQRGQPSTIVAGPGNDRPIFSPDGSQIAFLRQAKLGAKDIVIVRSDGSDQRVLTAKPLSAVGYMAWSPDGGSIAVVTGTTLESFDAALSGEPRVLTGNLSVDSVSGNSDFNPQMAAVFRPPAGAQILYLGRDGLADILFVANADGSAARALIGPSRTDIKYDDLASQVWSPDGSMIAFNALMAGTGNDWRVFIMQADGTGLRQLSRHTPGLSEGNPAWSPDGKRIALQRWIDDSAGNTDVRPVTVVGVEDGREVEVGSVHLNGFVSFAWSPDGSSILELPGDDTKQTEVVPVAAGSPSRPAWPVFSALSWQRVATD
jgi:dipeptidyl aminopeptidase/acylaminoacyl peptidase